jgi:hypothetical protein
MTLDGFATISVAGWSIILPKKIVFGVRNMGPIVGKRCFSRASGC